MALQHADLVYEDDMLVAAAVGRTLVGYWFGQPHAKGLRAFGAAQGEWLRQLGHPAYNLTVLSEDIGRSMDGEARTAAAEIRDANADALVGMGTLIEQSGFMGAIVRSTIGAIELIGRSKHKNEAFKTADAACARAAEALGEDDAYAGRIAAAIVELRTVYARQLAS